ncbi:MAG: hypothetical protein AAGF85_18670 [Bacteroidota bacterium]
MSYIDSAIVLAENLDAKTKGNVHYYKAIIFYLTDNFEEAITTSDIAYENYNRIADSYGLASINNPIRFTTLHLFI